MAKLRLNKILAQAGLTSRRGGDRLIVDGHVAVNGVVTRSPATLADPELDAITVDGRARPAISLLAVLRQVRAALDPDFAATRVRVSVASLLVPG